MALVRAERVLETSTTTGTGSLNLGGPVTGYRSFASVLSTNDTCYYAIVAVDSSGRPTGDWETGLGTLTASTTLARTTVLASSNGGAVVSLSAGTKQVFLTLTTTEIAAIVADISARALSSQVDVYSASDTWNKPTGAVSLDVILIGGGYGGASGGLTANSTLGSVDATGGLAGYEGDINIYTGIPADVFSSTVTVTVGAGGTGGASLTATGAGNPGNTGGSSSFGSLSAAAGNGTQGSSGKGGNVADAIGAAGATGTAGRIVGVGVRKAATGGATTDTYSISVTGVAGGSAASTTNATATGGNGTPGATLSGLAAGQVGTGGGGGGGAGVTSAGAATAAIGGDGGNGGFPGGGGGGGGAAGAQRSSLPTGSKSGKGGNGAGGVVIVITHF